MFIKSIDGLNDDYISCIYCDSKATKQTKVYFDLYPLEVWVCPNCGMDYADSETMNKLLEYKRQVNNLPL